MKMDKTEKKILDAALKVFAEKGYDGAKTKLIANESGFTEMTLFRKFGTKENLFNQVLKFNSDQITKDLEQLFIPSMEKSKDLQFLIESVIAMVENNFEYIKILLNEDHKSASVLKEGVINLAEFTKYVNPGASIDYEVVAFNIMAFSYFIIFNKRQGNILVDYDVAVEGFIKTWTESIKDGI
jgi:AcrR family transcriptional regulator